VLWQLYCLAGYPQWWKWYLPSKSRYKSTNKSYIRYSCIRSCDLQ